VRFEPAGFTGNSEIPIAKSIVDYVFRWLGSRFLSKDDRDALGIIPQDAYVTEAPEGSAGAMGAGLSFSEPMATTPDRGATTDAIGEAGGPKLPSAEAAVPPLAETAGGTDLPVLSNGHASANGHSNGGGSAGPAIKPLDLGGGTKVAFSVSADSPSCSDCGSIMVRSGSCYKCLNCGSTSGCS
jgi:ribonucleoside-diphosphate reductase alpha chain